MSIKKTTDFLAGIFVLLGILALAFLALRAASSDSLKRQPVYHVEAFFDNVGGLQARAPVRSSGVVVGRVDSVVLDLDRYQARVRLAMDQRYHFPKDSSLKILTSGLLGEQYLGIEAGADDKMLEDGGEVAMTQGAVVLENLIGQFLYGRAGSTEGGANPVTIPAAAVPPDAAPAAKPARKAEPAAQPAREQLP